MLWYYSSLALLSLRRNFVLSILMIVSIGVGVALTMTAFTILYVMSRDPIPEKSDQLFAVQIDNGGPRSRKPDDLEPPAQVSWRDASALLQIHQGARETAMYEVSVTVKPDDPRMSAFSVYGRATTAEFFPMFQVPTMYGSAWSIHDDATSASVVVISKRLNERLFGGKDSVGRTIRCNGTAYQVVGVLDDWDPKPRFYDVIGGMSFEEGDDFYLPLHTSIGRGMETAEYESCAGPRGSTFADLLKSECVWLQYWVELPQATDVQRYRNLLLDYSREQQKSGRFSWEPNVRLRNVRNWLVAQRVVPDDAQLSVVVAAGFFACCLVGAVALMLAKASAGAAEFAIRRTLGASSITIFSQVLVETGIVGILGAVLGLGLSLLSLHMLRALFPGGMGRIAYMNAQLLSVTIVIAVIATLCAGTYPAWRAMRVSLAAQLKGG
jgi:putative ABC transport system permease protein